ncbi:MAG: nucleotidyl transferase AbiEii/AbiGii toxin family protein [Candidatus Muirbacterium halophilum]|nr:nucleotidyl transferase AbiEii/AbiGii toxin family protein [Candidatus Muirbacterium halophilum]MCK9476408.1 nucleotidyl transferase AbiEii/AbiGii toxin family protein [Candidatus Muirbacterium halophilum]
MIHFNKVNFKTYIESLAYKHKFIPSLLEKDYYLTLFLNEINLLSEKLIFKGGTCLNKIYFEYFRLSEDLDFIMDIPQNKLTRTQRKELIKPLKQNLLKIIEKLGLNLDCEKSGGFNESKQYIFIILYNSVFYETPQSIKLEISMRFKNLLKVEYKKLHHIFLHPFTNEPIIKNETIKCLNLVEAVAEKLRAAATRKEIAPRDFYDLFYISHKKSEIWDKNLLEIFLEKLKEGGFDINSKNYMINLGRNNNEIKFMENRLELELLSVLNLEERESFELNKALKIINKNYKNMLEK